MYDHKNAEGTTQKAVTVRGRGFGYPVGTANDPEVTIVAPEWVKDALKYYAQKLHGTQIVFKNPNGSVASVETIDARTGITLKQLQYLARNEPVNTTGLIGEARYPNGRFFGNPESVYQGIAWPDIFALKTLVRECLIIGQTRATHYNGYKDPLVPQEGGEERIYLVDVAGPQFQQPGNEGRRYCLVTWPEQQKGSCDDEFFRRVIGSPKPSYHDAFSAYQTGKDPRYVKVSKNKQNGSFELFDTHVYKKLVENDVLRVGMAINEAAVMEEDGSINFKFLAYGTGAFADADDVKEKYKKKYHDVIKQNILEGVLAGLEKLFKQLPKPHKIGCIELPYYELKSDKQREAARAIEKLCKKNGVQEVYFENVDALKPRVNSFATGKNYITATTNCGDAHVVLGNEMEVEHSYHDEYGHLIKRWVRPSVDANVGANLTDKGASFAPALNHKMKAHFVSQERAVFMAEADALRKIKINYIVNDLFKSMRDDLDALKILPEMVLRSFEQFKSEVKSLSGRYEKMTNPEELKAWRKQVIQTGRKMIAREMGNFYQTLSPMEKLYFSPLSDRLPLDVLNSQNGKILGRVWKVLERKRSFNNGECNNGFGEGNESEGDHDRRRREQAASINVGGPHGYTLSLQGSDELLKQYIQANGPYQLVSSCSTSNDSDAQVQTFVDSRLASWQDIDRSVLNQYLPFQPNSQHQRIVISRIIPHDPNVPPYLQVNVHFAYPNYDNPASQARAFILEDEAIAVLKAVKSYAEAETRRLGYFVDYHVVGDFNRSSARLNQLCGWTAASAGEGCLRFDSRARRTYLNESDLVVPSIPGSVFVRHSTTLGHYYNTERLREPARADRVNPAFVAAGESKMVPQPATGTGFFSAPQPSAGMYAPPPPAPVAGGSMMRHGSLDDLVLTFSSPEQASEAVKQINKLHGIEICGVDQTYTNQIRIYPNGRDDFIKAITMHIHFTDGLAEAWESYQQETAASATRFTSDPGSDFPPKPSYYAPPKTSGVGSSWSGGSSHPYQPLASPAHTAPHAAHFSSHSGAALPPASQHFSASLPNAPFPSPSSIYRTQGRHYLTLHFETPEMAQKAVAIMNGISSSLKCHVNSQNPARIVMGHAQEPIFDQFVCPVLKANNPEFRRAWDMYKGIQSKSI